MKPETQAELKSATAAFICSVIASPWFWQRLPGTRSTSVRKERSKLKRAAVKARGKDPVSFVARILGSTFFAADPNLREPAAVALCELLREVSGNLEFEQTIKQFLIGKQSERHVVQLMRDFFVSMASRPGRPSKDKYRKAAAFFAQNGKASWNRLCVLYEPGYRSMDQKQQDQARKRMYAGVHRVLNLASISIRRNPHPGFLER